MIDNKEIILITGKNGLIASHLAHLLEKEYIIRWLTRNPKAENEYKWDIDKNYIDEKSVLNISHIIHLAGAGIADKKWTKNRKKEIINSRVNGSKLLLNACINQKVLLKSVISASAIGYYGQTTSQNIYKEDDAPSNDFVGTVCQLWEDSINEFIEKKITQRIVKIRTGIVFANNGGALPKMILPYIFRTKAIIGKGNQYVPWIHIDDICNLYRFVLKNESINGTYNGVSSEYSNYKQVMAMVETIYNRKNFSICIPACILKIMLGEQSSLLIHGSRISNKKIKNEGFSFAHDDLRKCLSNLLFRAK